MTREGGTPRCQHHGATAAVQIVLHWCVTCRACCRCCSVGHMPCGLYSSGLSGHGTVVRCTQPHGQCAVSCGPSDRVRRVRAPVWATARCGRRCTAGACAPGCGGGGGGLGVAHARACSVLNATPHAPPPPPPPPAGVCVCTTRQNDARVAGTTRTRGCCADGTPRGCWCPRLVLQLPSRSQSLFQNRSTGCVPTASLRATGSLYHWDNVSTAVGVHVHGPSSWRLLLFVGARPMRAQLTHGWLQRGVVQAPPNHGQTTPLTLVHAHDVTVTSGFNLGWIRLQRIADGSARKRVRSLPEQARSAAACLSTQTWFARGLLR